MCGLEDCRFAKQLRSTFDVSGDILGLVMLILFQCIFLAAFAILGFSYAKSSSGISHMDGILV